MFSKIKHHYPIFTIILSLCFLSTSCTTLKPYERIYTNDPEMQMAGNAQKQFHNYIQSIREGGAQAESSKSSGGCGCN